VIGKPLQRPLDHLGRHAAEELQVAHAGLHERCVASGAGAHEDATNAIAATPLTVAWAATADT